MLMAIGSYLAQGPLLKPCSDGCSPRVLLSRVTVYWKLVSGPIHLDATTGLADFTRWE